MPGRNVAGPEGGLYRPFVRLTPNTYTPGGRFSNANSPWPSVFAGFENRVRLVSGELRRDRFNQDSRKWAAGVVHREPVRRGLRPHGEVGSDAGPEIRHLMLPRAVRDESKWCDHRDVHGPDTDPAADVASYHIAARSVLNRSRHSVKLNDAGSASPDSARVLR